MSQVFEPFRSSGPNRRLPVATPHSRHGDPATGAHPSTEAHRDALQLWLRWNEGYEQLTARMFDVRHDPVQLEALAEQLDRLRAEAVAASRRLVG